MKLFGSVKNELQQCLQLQQDVGNYKWLPEYTYADITGASYYQPALTKFAKKYGTRSANVEMVRQPENKVDQKAIAYFCDGVEIGHVPTQALDCWHKLFNFVGDENTRLVGVVTFPFWDKEKIYLAKPKIQVLRKLPKPPGS